MCGIAGILFVDPAAASAPESLAAVRAMCGALAHRGPDDQGLSRHGPVVLGHRRLSILDLSEAGRQPMGFGDGRYWISYNGEIYNYVELREELRGLGYGFKTGTDTEVLLAAWDRWGPDCLGRLNGMWAFLLWDAVRERLYGARDRIGVKPFYYRMLPGGALAAASEIKALTLPSFPSAAPVPEAVAAFLAWGEVDRMDGTFFQGIERLPSAHWLEVEPGRPPVLRRYWSIPDAPPDRSLGLDQAAECLAGLLEDATAKRLRSDVTVGTCLSGGLDSSTVTCLIRRCREAAGQPLAGQHSFSACFDDPRFDERKHMDVVLAATGIEAHRVFPTGEALLEDLDALCLAQDEPFGSTSIYAQYRVFRLARETGIVVTLDGQGADEQLAGYEYYRGSWMAELFARGSIRAFVRELRGANRMEGRPIRKLLRDVRRSLRRPKPRRRIPEWIEPVSLRGPDRTLERAAPGQTRMGKLRAALHQELTCTSLPALLRYADHNSMAFGVEARFPFLDVRVVELIASLPPELLIHEGWTKWIARRAFRDILPESICWRRDKLGFQPPEEAWFRGPLAGRFESEVLGPGSRVRDWCKLDEVEADWKAFKSGSKGYRPTFWRLLNLGIWLRGQQGAVPAPVPAGMGKSPEPGP